MAGGDGVRTREFLLRDPVGRGLCLHWGGGRRWGGKPFWGLHEGNYWSGTTKGSKAWCYTFSNDRVTAKRRQGYIRHAYSVRLVCG